MKSYMPILAAALLLGATAAHAGAAPVVAKLQAPLEKAKRPIAGQASFACEGDTCTAFSPASATNTLQGCRELVRRVGAVSSFGAEGQAFDADKLARCNAGARK